MVNKLVIKTAPKTLQEVILDLYIELGIVQEEVQDLKRKLRKAKR